MNTFTKDPSTHPANGPLTEERLIRVRDELAAAAKRSDGGNLGYMMDDAAKAIDELLALRKTGQEPVYQVRHGDQWRDLNKAQYDDHVNLGAEGLRTLYAAPQLPQPAVDELLKEHLRMVECMLVDYREGNSGHAKEWIRHISKSSDKFEEKHSLSPWLWARSACRAAMLQGAEPVSQPYKLREGVAAIRSLGGIDAGKIQAERDALNESVQEWIPCSERMPDEIGRYWCYVEEQNSLGKSHYQWNCSWNGDRWWVESDNGGRVTHWMPLPNPPKQNADC